ncbi:MAG: hypothetical protein P1P65_01645 [Treponema sp.]
MKNTHNCTQQRYGAVFFRLFLMYTAVVPGIHISAAFIRNGKGAGGKKSVLKLLLAILAAVYIGGCFALVFAVMMVNVYDALKPLGMQRLMFELLMMSLFFLLFIPNFLLTLSTYSAGRFEQNLRAMPIPPHIVFGSKFCAHCLPPIVFSLFFSAVAAEVYGSRGYPSLQFYALLFTGAILFPLPVISLCYLIHIIIMRFTGIFKNTYCVMILTAVLGLFLAAAVNAAAQAASGLRQNSATAAAFIANGKTLTRAAHIALPSRLLAAALTAGTVRETAAAFIPFVLICLAAPALLIAAFSGMYEKSLAGFGEQTLKKLSRADRRRFTGSAYVRRPVFTALVLREIHAVNREPAYLLNGPVMIIFFPAIFGIMYLTGSLRFPPEAAGLIQDGFGALLAGVCGALLASSSSIAATAVSRDAHNLRLIKSLPLPVKPYMQAKLVHAMLFAFIASAAGSGGTVLLFSLSFADLLPGLLISLSAALCSNLLALLLDTAHPKLGWDTPAAAVKQNLNTIVVMFSNAVLLIAAAVTAILTGMPKPLYTLLFSGVPLLFSAVLAHFFWPYAERKIQSFDV